MSTLRPLPDLADAEALAERGRASALIAARNNAVEALRDVAVNAQHLRAAQLSTLSGTLREVAARFDELSRLDTE